MADDQPQEMPLTDDELGLALRISSLDCRTEAGNVFFNSFSYVRDLREHNYAACMTNGLRLLVKCKSLDEAGYLRIHKGSAYYWIAMAAFLSYNFEAAAYFFDAAVSEDLRAGRHPVTSSTPSFKFLLVQGDFSEQAAKNLVQELQRRLEFTINDYNSRPGRTPSHPTLSIEHLREDFILPALVPANSHLRSLPTALIPSPSNGFTSTCYSTCAQGLAPPSPSCSISSRGASCLKASFAPTPPAQSRQAQRPSFSYSSTSATSSPCPTTFPFHHPTSPPLLRRFLARAIRSKRLLSTLGELETPSAIRSHGRSNSATSSTTSSS